MKMTTDIGQLMDRHREIFPALLHRQQLEKDGADGLMLKALAEGRVVLVWKRPLNAVRILIVAPEVWNKLKAKSTDEHG